MCLFSLLYCFTSIGGGNQFTTLCTKVRVFWRFSVCDRSMTVGVGMYILLSLLEVMGAGL